MASCHSGQDSSRCFCVHLPSPVIWTPHERIFWFFLALSGPELYTVTFLHYVLELPTSFIRVSHHVQGLFAPKNTDFLDSQKCVH